MFSHYYFAWHVAEAPFLELGDVWSPKPMSVLNYVPDRLYLAAYIHPPNSETLFPYPELPASPRKRAQAAAAPKRTPCYFSVDDTLLYNAFHHDFGPLHIGHLYRFAIQFHDILGAKENKDRPIVFWSHADPRSMSSLLLEMRDLGCFANRD